MKELTAIYIAARKQSCTSKCTQSFYDDKPADCETRIEEKAKLSRYKPILRHPRITSQIEILRMNHEIV
jgi:hypothetical protein